MTNNYTDTEAYQQEIANQYQKRVSKFETQQVSEALQKLGFSVSPESLQQATVGNVNATYLTPKLVVKINQNNAERSYLPNKIVSDVLGEKAPVVKVLSYDFFDKTNFEVLVMQRSEGKMWLETILTMPTEERAVIFKQVLDVVNLLHKISFENFGTINQEAEAFPAYSEFLKDQFVKNISTIRQHNLASNGDIEKIEAYVLENLDLFEHEESVFVHTDLHMGNILHVGNTVTGILDFDTALKAPSYRTLVSLLGFIDYPSQFVEGTKDFQGFKGKNFYELLPLVKESFTETFQDPLLLKKLNVQGVIIGVYWVSQNWSETWNQEMIKNLIENELAMSEEMLAKSYYGKIFSH